MNAIAVLRKPIIALLGALTITGFAHAIPVTYVYGGIAGANSGDGLGLFGPAGNSLQGARYEITATFDLPEYSTNLWPMYQCNDACNQLPIYGVPVKIGAEVNGIKHQWNFFADYSVMRYQTYLSEMSFAYDLEMLYAYGESSNGLSFMTYQAVASYDVPFIGAFNGAQQQVSYNPSSQDLQNIEFDVSNGETGTHFFDGSITYLRINTDTASVPEPGSLPLVLAGISAGFAFLRGSRKRGKLQANTKESAV